MSLPMPMMNIINGGKHALGGADIQEGMIIPIGASNIAQAIQIGAEVFHALLAILAKGHLPTQVGDEGGFALSVKDDSAVLKTLEKAVASAGYRVGQDIGFALDVAASELYQDGRYDLKREDKVMTAAEMIAWYEQLAKKYPLLSIEDGLAEDDWSNWTALTHDLGNIQLVGDDLLVTNPLRLQKAIELKAGNAILIKLNQIGSLTETIKTINLAKQNNWRCIISHRSGETEDTFISHLAVGTGAGQIKTGSLSRTERIAKYNELLRIAELAPDLQLAKPF